MRERLPATTETKNLDVVFAPTVGSALEAAWRYSPRSGAPHRASGHRDGTESVCRNVKRWQNTAIALRCTAAGILEAAKGLRLLKAHKHLPALRAVLAVHQSKCVSKRVEDNADVA